ncbi:MAG TPA: hypothetical protein VMB71_11645 [Acetobacteraceae bacterium]|nr:hypothetical protein [Acetobacteraceae bacterium]
MWREAYLETCCRSALHRAMLAGQAGRPGDTRDRTCLERLAQRRLVVPSGAGRYVITEAGEVAHRTIVLKRPCDTP